jgi:3-hydroxyisobutyrate dehydrogenase
MRVGVAGMGRMGASIAQRLIEVGHQVTVWNRTAAKSQPLVALGAKVAATPKDLANASEMVVTMLFDKQALDTAFDGPNGLLAGDVTGKLFIDMSTVRPIVEQQLAQKVKAKGASIIECPVGGSTVPAKEGKLFGFVGGEKADFDRAKPLLDQMCRRVEYIGDHGAGSSMKLAINLPLLVYYQALGEALVLLQPTGLSTERIMDIMIDTNGAPTILKGRHPAIAKELAGEIVPTAFEIDGIRKDMRTMIEEAQFLGADSPVTQTALYCYDGASAMGRGGGDGAALPGTWVKRAIRKK